MLSPHLNICTVIGGYLGSQARRSLHCPLPTCNKWPTLAHLPSVILPLPLAPSTCYSMFLLVGPCSLVLAPSSVLARSQLQLLTAGSCPTLS